MEHDEEFDQLEQGGTYELPRPSSDISEKIGRLQARADAFRDLADRFYMLWWNLPGMTTRDVDRDIQDMFRMYMDLAPSLGVSKNGIPELRECCGKRREWAGVDPMKSISGADGIVSPYHEDLGWGLGDIVRRVSRFFGFKHCPACDRRRIRLNNLFRREK